MKHCIRISLATIRPIKVNHRLEEREKKTPFIWPMIGMYTAYIIMYRSIVMRAKGFNQVNFDSIVSFVAINKCLCLTSDTRQENYCVVFIQNMNHSQRKLSSWKQWNFVNWYRKLEQHRFKRKTGHGKNSLLFKSWDTVDNNNNN